MMKIRVLLLNLCFLAVSCSGSPPDRNQQQGTVPPNGKFTLHLPIELQTTNPTYKGTRVWKVTIKNASGQTVYKDDESTMVGTLSVYWGWGADNKVWLYNSDDGRIWHWEVSSEGWRKIPSSREDGIPSWILPDYVRNR